MLEYCFEKLKNTLQTLESLTVSIENIDFSNLKNEEMVKSKDAIFEDLTECFVCMREDQRRLEYYVSDIERNLNNLKESETN